MSLADDVNREIARLTGDVKTCLQSQRVARTLQEEVQMLEQDIVYDDYEEVSPMARASRRKYHGGIQDRKNILVCANELALTIESKAPLQHSYSYWKNVNAADVVIKGKKNYKQPYPRNYLTGHPIPDELAKELDDTLVALLIKLGYDATESW